jgi:hypothetical protein
MIGNSRIGVVLIVANNTMQRFCAAAAFLPGNLFHLCRWARIIDNAPSIDSKATQLIRIEK